MEWIDNMDSGDWESAEQWTGQGGIGRQDLGGGF